MSDDYLWNPEEPPDPAVQRLESVLRPLAHTMIPLRAETLVARPSRRYRWHVARPWLLAATAMLVVAAGVRMAWQDRTAPWRVTSSRGRVVVRSANGILAHGPLTSGGVVETDTRSSATLTVGRIGRAELGPDSRLRLVETGSREHRLSLEHGTLHAVIDAPPRYFLVETASALAVDLGCVYTLSATEQGDGMLTVEEGEVELQRGAVRITVLAGNSAALRARMGPGLPFPTQASAVLQRAVAAYDANPSAAAAVDGLLAAADAHSTITLWHLLQRESPAIRARVYDRLSSLAPPPSAVTRERVVRGDSGALQRWRTELQRSWVTELPRWRHWWNTMRRMM